MNDFDLILGREESEAHNFQVTNFLQYLTICGPNHAIKIDLVTGKVDIPPELLPDEAAKLFWQAVEAAFPHNNH